MTAGLLLAVVLLALAPLPAPAAGPGPMTAVELTLVNETARPLRCVAVLAHFMSEELGSVGPGAEREIALRREPASGLLALSPRDGRDVPLENLQCGLAGDWQASVGELPLGTLRDDPAQAFRAACALDGSRVACRVEALR